MSFVADHPFMFAIVEYEKAEERVRYLRSAAEDEEEPDEPPVAASASFAAAAWCMEKLRGQDDWEGEQDLAWVEEAFFLGAAAVVVQATAMAMETAGDLLDGEAKPPCCQTPRR
ncbi:hypothetical protein BAE44_0007439 [Dichanthelium oligosanthes]|uniref:Uncharacterized protein n=1 Tax=Dichanthelium oligosanthes TaxID=888268 RepID=A0A1E5W2G7_9POAL|nr:hypothetical protein BAE44_0007439 [Dichanthelium oligosanthes]